MTLLLITRGRVLDAEGNLDQPPLADILIDAGSIVAIGPEGTVGTSENARIIDASGMLIVPGFVNAHYHSHDVLLRGMFEQLPLEIWGLYSFPSNYPRRSDEEVSIRTLIGAAENLLSGITTVQDMTSIVGADTAHVDALQAAYASSGIRAIVALQYGDRATVDTVPFWREELPIEIQAQLGPAINAAPMRALIESILDAPASERLTWGLGPSAPQRCSEHLLRWTACLSEERRLQVFTHVYETRSQALLARRHYRPDADSLISFLNRMGLLTERLTIAHGVWIQESEIRHLAEAGVSLACNPISNLKLLNGIAPVRDYAKAGATIGLGCDNCSGNDAQDMFAAMKAFAFWWANSGDAGEHGAARRAFEAATSGGAAALGLSKQIGAIRPGYRADLTFLRLDDPAFVPLNSAVRQLVYAATPRAVDTVLVAGKLAVSGGKIASFDLGFAQSGAERLRADLCDCYATIVSRFAPVLPELLRIHRRIACEPLPINRLNLV